MAKSPRDAACSHVYRKYPHLKGVRPSVGKAGANKVYTFSKSVATSPGGPKMKQVVRVTVKADGSIVKVVASK
jgi:hypothetical protein